MYREGDGRCNHRLSPIWPFTVDDLDQGKESRILPGLRARHVGIGTGHHGIMLGVMENEGEKGENIS